MKWVFERVFGAMLAGVGWKLGADAYESIKRRLRQKQEDGGAGDIENGAAAEEVVGPQEEPSEDDEAASVFVFKGKE